jgi:P27 family predicted phage terminase small subunit
LNDREPQVPRSRPSAPAHVSEKARETWGYVTGILDRMGVLTEADAIGVEMLCEAYADKLAARASLALPVIAKRNDKVSGEEIVWTIAEAGARTYLGFGKDGVMIRQRPEVAMIADADRRIRGWLAEFGMTASARTRVKTSEPEKADEADRFFGS